ncbi:MAG: pyruvate dehydrogenase [Clostridiaceae bacterium BRH_c20a]|nr:MAG: pyruvate dehydrogenase [Clostridiaceae bacterium BRH_c20a]
MREMNMAEATLEAMIEEMRQDDNVFVLGEDIASQGGIFGQFKGLADLFGKEKVIDTPISETAIMGAGLGAALTGMRPVIDMHYVDFIGVAMDEMCNQIAKIRYMSGGQVKAPLVVRAPDGLINSAAAQHSQNLEAWFVHTPGLKVVTPSNPADAKGLLKAAIRDDDPVLYLENKALFKRKGMVPDGEFIIPIGEAARVRDGKDVTIITYSIMVSKSLEAADILSKQEGIEIEVIDLRTLFPLDKEIIFSSIKKTGHLMIVHEACKIGGLGSEISAMVAEECIEYLDGPIIRLGQMHVPVPFSPIMEKYITPNVNDIVNGVKKMLINSFENIITT